MKATIANQMASAPRVYPRSSNSANVYYKKRKPRKYKKKAQVAKSFRVAFHKMQPSKEIRYDVQDLAMDTSTSVASRLEAKYLDSIVQGTQLNHRLGSNVHISYVHIRGTVQSNSTAKAKALRVLLLREVNLGSIDITTFADLFKGPGSSATYAPIGTQRDLQWPVNNEKAYTLYDRTHVIKPEYEGITHFNKKVRVNKIVRYPANDAAAYNPYHGHLILIMLLADCDNTTSATTVVLSTGVRVFFKDYHKAR